MNKQKKEKKKLTKHEKCFRWLHRLYNFPLRILYPVKKYGAARYFDDRAYLIIGNHLSIMDVIPVAISTHKPIHYLAKKELFVKGFTKWFTAKCECIPINRDGNDVRALMTAMKYLKNGEHVSLFPEGTRNKTDDMFLPFKSGASVIAIRTKTPILPLVQVKKMRAFHKVHVLYGEPFELSEFYDKKLTDEDIAAADEVIRKKLEDMYLELKEILADKKKRK